MISSNEFKAVATPYVFIALPFVALIIVKAYTGKLSDLLVTSDWSIASAMIYSSSVINVRSATRNIQGSVNHIGLDWFMTTTISMAVINVVVYVLVLIKPSIALGLTQIVLFLLASLAHFKYGRVVYRLKR